MGDAIELSGAHPVILLLLLLVVILLLLLLVIVVIVLLLWYVTVDAIELSGVYLGILFLIVSSVKSRQMTKSFLPIPNSCNQICWGYRILPLCARLLQQISCFEPIWWRRKETHKLLNRSMITLKGSLSLRSSSRCNYPATSSTVNHLSISRLHRHCAETRDQKQLCQMKIVRKFGASFANHSSKLGGGQTKDIV